MYLYFADNDNAMEEGVEEEEGEKELDLLRQADQAENVSLDQFGNISTPSLKSTLFSQ